MRLRPKSHPVRRLTAEEAFDGSSLSGPTRMRGRRSLRTQSPGETRRVRRHLHGRGCLHNHYASLLRNRLLRSASAVLTETSSVNGPATNHNALGHLKLKVLENPSTVITSERRTTVCRTSQKRTWELTLAKAQTHGAATPHARAPLENPLRPLRLDLRHNRLRLRSTLGSRTRTPYSHLRRGHDCIVFAAQIFGRCPSLRRPLGELWHWRAQHTDQPARAFAPTLHIKQLFGSKLMSPHVAGRMNRQGRRGCT